MDIKLVLTDIDGVWTDGGMYYDQTGNEWKKFNTADSAGVLLLREAGLETGIITGEETEIVKRRAAKLKISILETGVKNKLAAFDKISQKFNIPFSQIAYIGDDIIDIPVLQKAGWSAVPKNAPNYVAQYARTVVDVKGGDGAFRAFAESILEELNLFDRALASFIQKLK